MKRFTQCKNLIVPLLAVLCLGSCNDISEPSYVQAHTLVTRVSLENVLTSPADEQDNDTGVTLIEPEDDNDVNADIVEEKDTMPLTLAEPEYMTSPQAELTTPAETTTTVTTTEETTTTTTTTAAVTTTAETTTAATPSESTATAAPEVQTAAVAAASDQPISYNVIGQNGILVSYQDGHYRGIMACFGTYGMCDRYTTAVNTFAAKLPDTKVYSLTAPIASEFYTPQKFWDSGFTVSQYNKCERIRENLSGAAYVDAYSALAAHKDEDIYARTDHHWNPLGAYYAAEAFAKAADIDFPELSKYTPVSRSGYVGSMYTYSKDYHLYNDPEVFTMYLSPNADSISTKYYNSYFSNGWSGDLFVSRNAASFYCSFIGSDDRITHITTDNANGRTLVVFKMSYGNALIPFLTSGFENIYVCDMRYFELNGVQFCKDVGATDLLFTDCVMMIAGNAAKYLEYILAR